MVRNKAGSSKSDEKNQPSAKLQRLRDKNAPKVPVNAYSRFLQQNFKSRQDNEKAQDVNKRLAAQWASMSEQEKQPYRDEYVKARDEYYEKMATYKQTAQYKNFQKEKNEKQKKNRRSNKGYDEDEFEEAPRGSHSKATTSSKTLFPEGIPIFSKEFMEYNKGREREFKALRKQNNDVGDECNRIEQHIEHMNQQMRLIRADNIQKENASQEMEDTMNNWRETIIAALAKAKLLDTLKLDQKKSTTDELISKLEGLSMGKNKETLQAVKQSLANIRLYSVI